MYKNYKGHLIFFGLELVHIEFFLNFALKTLSKSMQYCPVKPHTNFNTVNYTKTRFLEKIGLKIAKDVLDYALHSGRKTIKTKDIELATKK